MEFGSSVGPCFKAANPLVLISTSTKKTSITLKRRNKKFLLRTSAVSYKEFAESALEETRKRVVLEPSPLQERYTLSMAYAAARFVESSLRALDGDGDVYKCSFVESTLTDLPFFASRIKLGKNGVEAEIESDLQGLTEYEQKALEALKPELKGSTEKGIAFANKPAN